MCAILFSFLLGASSCDDSFIYEDEKDCSTKVQFVFKKHRQVFHSLADKEQDVFSSTVGSVHLFVYDSETGDLVFEKTEKTDNLSTASELGLGSATDRCFMSVNIKPGTYRFVAWCGLDENDTNNAFYLTETRAGTNRYSECRLKLSEATGMPVNHEKYDGLYHGVVHSAEVSVHQNGTQVIPVELTKNTNDIAVWVQHTSAMFDNGDYEVVYTDANGSLKFEDNSVSRNDRLEFHPHTTSILTAQTEYNGALVEAGAMVAHLSTSRLMEAHKDDARLEVRDRDGNTVFSIPFIQYVLQMQTFTSDAQYYLDCEDTYNCSFYLTGGTEQGGVWSPAMIIINNWVMVPQQNGEL